MIKKLLGIFRREYEPHEFLRENKIDRKLWREMLKEVKS